MHERGFTGASVRDIVKAGDLPSSTECGPLADFFIPSLQGATLRAKAECTAAPIKVFKKFIFSTVLAGPAASTVRTKAH